MRAKIFLLSAAVLAAPAAQAEIKLGEAASGAFLGKSFVEPGATCASPAQLLDFVEADGGLVRRDALDGLWTYTPLSRAEGDAATLRVSDEVGIGRTDTVYRLIDGVLREWTQSYYEDPDAKEASMIEVSEGRRTLDEAGNVLTQGPETTAFTPCPAYVAPVAAPIPEKLDGQWGLGSCASGSAGLRFELAGAVPRVITADIGNEEADAAYYVFQVRESSGKLTIIYGSAFEAGEMEIASWTPQKMTVAENGATHAYTRCP